MLSLFTTRVVEVWSNKYLLLSGVSSKSWFRSKHTYSRCYGMTAAGSCVWSDFSLLDEDKHMFYFIFHRDWAKSYVAFCRTLNSNRVPSWSLPSVVFTSRGATICYRALPLPPTCLLFFKHSWVSLFLGFFLNI